MYIADMEKRLARHSAYWLFENHDSPIIAACAPAADAPRRQRPPSKGAKDVWLSAKMAVDAARYRFESTYFAGDALPHAFANLGPDVFAAFLGAEIEFGKDTSWSVPFVKDWRDHSFRFDENNPYWKKIAEITTAMLDDSSGDYLVGPTDIHAGMDALVSMRGAENVCMDLFDCPEDVLAALGQVKSAFQEVISRSYGIIGEKQRGMTNWMGVYHPDRWYVSSCDFIYMISPDAFDAFCRDYIRSEAQIIGNNIFHLDGVGSLTHIDKLLEMDEINGIQWVYGAGRPTAAHWIDVLKRIQDAGKLIHVSCTPDDMPKLLSSGLRPEGVFYSVWCSSPNEADGIVEAAKRAYL